MDCLVIIYSKVKSDRYRKRHYLETPQKYRKSQTEIITFGHIEYVFLWYMPNSQVLIVIGTDCIDERTSSTIISRIILLATVKDLNTIIGFSSKRCSNCIY